MSTVKFTMQRGKVGLRDVVVSAGSAEVQSDTISVNIDYNRLTKGDALGMVQGIKQAIHAGKWPATSGGAPAPTNAIIISVIGDSNATGTAVNEGSIVWTPDPNILTLNLAGAFVQYAPGAITGIDNGNEHGHVGPEAEFARQYRAANPTKRVYIVKQARSGSVQSSAPGTNNWTVGSANMVTAKNRLDVAKTLISGAGLIVDNIFVHCSLGINDASSAFRILYSSPAAAMYADIKANWLRGTQDKILQFRVTNNNTSTPTIRAAQQQNAKNDNTQVKLVDTDGFGKNVDIDPGGGDVTHYNLAGMTACGGAAYAVATGGAGIVLDVLTLETFDDNSRGWTTPAGWSVSGGKLNAVAVGNFSASGLLATIDRLSANYQVTYDLVVTSGSVRIQTVGGSTNSGVTRTASGTYTETIASPATDSSGDVRLTFSSISADFTGTIDNVKIVRP